jgi:murein DD-endopeptidase MepM/ murein hydrolase activator NlpD
MLVLYILQTVVPLALIAWIALVPQRSVVGFWMQALSTGIGIVALALTGILLFPPWWTPWGFGLLLIFAIIIALRRGAQGVIEPQRAVDWIVTIGFAAFAWFAADQTRLAYAAARMPHGATIDLASPLGAGRYLVINGGATTELNAHADALDQSILTHRAFYGTAYGVDIVAIDRLGLRANGFTPRDPRRYRVFGAAVVAPCPGTVIAAVDGLPDMRVPEQDDKHLAGNHVILRCGAVDIVLAHFRRGSVRVTPGQELAVGAAIAEVGNSGATGEPHLHIHAQLPGTEATPFSGHPIALRLDGRFLIRNERFSGADGH